MSTQVIQASIYPAIQFRPSPAKRRFIGALTTPFARLPRVLLCKILQDLDDSTLGRCQEVCRIWKSCIQTELTLCTRIIHKECFYRFKKLAHKERTYGSEFFRQHFVRFLSHASMSKARDAATAFNDNATTAALIDLELSQNNLGEAQTLISNRLAKPYKDFARMKFITALIKNFDYTAALETALKISRCELRFEAYLKIAEADPLGGYEHIAEKLDTERYRRNLTKSQLALFHAKCAKLFAPHDFTKAKAYAKVASTQDEYRSTYGDVLAIQAEVDLDAALAELHTIPKQYLYALLKQLVPLAAKYDLHTARSLVDLVDDPSCRFYLLFLLSRDDPTIRLEELESLFNDSKALPFHYNIGAVIMEFLERGYKRDLFLEKAKQQASLIMDDALVVKIVQFEAKTDIAQAISTIERLKLHMTPHTLAKCWLVLAREQNSQIPKARSYALNDAISDYDACDLIDQLDEVTKKFTKLSLSK